MLYTTSWYCCYMQFITVTHRPHSSPFPDQTCNPWNTLYAKKNITSVYTLSKCALTSSVSGNNANHCIHIRVVIDHLCDLCHHCSRQGDNDNLSTAEGHLRLSCGKRNIPLVRRSSVLINNVQMVSK